MTKNKEKKPATLHLRSSKVVKKRGQETNRQIGSYRCHCNNIDNKKQTEPSFLNYVEYQGPNKASVAAIFQDHVPRNGKHECTAIMKDYEKRNFRQ
jgi:hypothetical protein